MGSFYLHPHRALSLRWLSFSYLLTSWYVMCCWYFCWFLPNRNVTNFWLQQIERIRQFFHCIIQSVYGIILRWCSCNMHAAKLIGWCDAKLGAKKAIDISSSKLESSYICGQNNSTLRKTTLYDRQKSAVWQKALVFWLGLGLVSFSPRVSLKADCTMTAQSERLQSPTARTLHLSRLITSDYQSTHHTVNLSHHGWG